MSPVLLKDKHLTKTTREFQWCVFTFLHELGVVDKEADTFAILFSHIIEFDNAYRVRLQDIMSETDKVKLLNPIKEIKRLSAIIKERDWIGIAQKYLNIINILALVLYIPRVRRAFNTVIDGMIIGNMQLEDSDRYWLCLYNPYRFMGMDNEQRTEYAKINKWNYPQKMV